MIEMVRAQFLRMMLLVNLEIGLLQLRAEPVARKECVVKGGKV
jgi:hypothetical protein